MKFRHYSIMIGVLDDILLRPLVLKFEPSSFDLEEPNEMEGFC